MKKLPRPALGRGLSALVSTPVSIHPQPAAPQPYCEPQGNVLPQCDNGDTPTVAFVEISSIKPNPTQPRTVFKDMELEELSQSIRSLGVIQPVLVRPLSSQNGCFEIVAGERRWRAAQRAGLEKLPVIVKELTDREVFEQALVENVQRQDLNPIEEARAYQRLSDEFSLNQKEVAERVGKDRTTVSNLTRLLKLPGEVIELIEAGELSTGHAKVLLSIKEPAAQIRLARKSNAEKLSVRELEGIVSRVVVLDSGKRPGGDLMPKPDNGENENAFPEIVDRLRNALGTRVKIKHHSGGKGKIEIEYFSEQELDRLVEALSLKI